MLAICSSVCRKRDYVNAAHLAGSFRPRPFPFCCSIMIMIIGIGLTHLMHTGPETCVTRVLPGDMLAAAAQTGMKFLRGVLIGCILATTPALL